MLKTSLITVLLLILSFNIQAQSCFNIGFEDSSFVNWEGYTGTYDDTLEQMAVGIVPGRHTIISAHPTVPYDSLCDTLLPKVAPGSNFSVRLGNSQVSFKHEKLIYTLDIDSSNVIFAYGSAIVLQDPGHPVTSQPYFQVTLLDSNNNKLDTACGQIEIFSDPSIPGFVQAQNGFGAPLYRDWTYGGVDLTSYIGQTVKVEFTTKDCNAGGHYGYAYIDAGCYPKEIVTQFCEGSEDSIRMTAPIGFEYLWNTGDTTRTLAVLPSLADSAYYVTCTSSLTGCNFELSTTTEPTYYYNFGISETSCGEAKIQTSLKISRGDIDEFYWNFGDTTTLADTSNDMTPTYTYPGPGQYAIYLIANDGLGCYTDTLRDTVNIYFPPEADFLADTVCLKDRIFFQNLSDVSPNIDSGYFWTYGDSTTTDTAFSPNHLYKDDTTFNVTLVVWSDSLQCGDTVTKTVLVHPRPKAKFSHLEPDSCIPHEVHFINESSFKDSSEIIINNWHFGNGDSAFMQNPVYIFEEPGVYSPELTVIDKFGCRATIKYTDLIKVANIPIAEFSANKVEVDIRNATIVFDNMSQDADEYLWMFGDGSTFGSGTSYEAEPQWTFKKAGNYSVVLNAVSTYGCFDTAHLDITVIDDRLFVPNVITPNGDGVNDVFSFSGDHSSMTDFSCEIYNRWGTLIFSTGNPGFSWDGSINGEFVSPGSYFFIISYKGYKNKDLQHRGSFDVLQ